MKIAFDSQIFTMQEYGGISRYICSLAQQLNTHHDVEAKIFAPLHINAYADTLPSSLAYGVKVPRIRNTGRIVHAASQLLSRVAISRFKPQFVHETYYAARSVAPKGTKKVVTVYDMIHERLPDMFPKYDQTSKLKREAVLRADHVICISENTKQDLLELVPVSPEKISVVYLGFDQLMSIDEKPNLKDSIVKLPYLLFVGGRGYYKNFNGLLQAYANSSWIMQNYRIVCVGDGKLRADELKLMSTLGISEWQVEQVNANDTLLAQLYKYAAAFVYPSKYEGFGIPPLEAMSMGCPVICSNSSSIPEVVGDAGEYFDPDKIDSMRVAIECVLQDKDLREILVKKGIERCKFFSWKQCASETLAIYRSIV